MRKLLLALAALAMTLAATTYTFWRDREHERARADALQVRVAALESRPRANPASQPSSPVAPESITSEAPAPQAAVGTSGASTNTEEYDEYTALRRRMLRDPKYYEIARARMRPNFAPRRTELIRVLGISSATADAIVDYWIDRQLRAEARVLPEATTEQEGVVVQEIFAREQRADEEKLRAILGDDFPKMQEYIASHPSRNRTNQLRTRLADSSDALRDDQVEPLIGALHTEQTRLQQEMQDLVATLDPEVATSPQAQRKLQKQFSDLYKAAHRRTHSSAAAILSPKQLTELDAMLRADFEGMQAQNALRQMEESAGEN